MSTMTTSDGVRITFDREGEGAPIIWVAGFTAPASSWLLSHTAAVGAGHQSVLYDRRSHGESETTARGQRIARHAADLAELIAHLGLDEVTLVGHSMGANIIWSYCDVFGTNLLRRIVLVDQTPAMINDAQWNYGFYGCTRENSGYLFDQGVPATNRGQSWEVVSPGMAAIDKALGAPPAFRSTSAPETLRLLHDHVHQDWRDVAQNIDRPFLMIAGAESQFWPAEHAEVVARSNLAGYGHHRVIESAGHLVPTDQPTVFKATVLDWLADPLT